MAADKGMVGYHVPVDQETHLVLLVVHKPQDSDGSGGEIHVFFHKFWLCEG